MSHADGKDDMSPKKSSNDKITKELDNNRKLQLSKNISFGIYLPEKNIIKLTKIKGKFIHSMGYQMNQEKNDAKYDYLSAEEALYLIENNNLIVYLSADNVNLDIPLSIQQCYEFFFQTKNSLSLSLYKLYSDLISFGYILRKPFQQGLNKENYAMKNKPESVKIIELQAKITHNRETRPIINKSDHGNLTTKEIFNKLNNLIPNIQMNDIRNNLQDLDLNEAKSHFKHEYNVYMPNKKFKKSQPTNLLFQINTQANETNQVLLPTIRDFLKNHTVEDQNVSYGNGNNNCTNLYAFVCHNDVLLYTFNNEFCLPSVIGI